MTPVPPTPDDHAKVSWPTQIKKQTWVYLLRRTTHEFGHDGGIDAAAGLTFFAVLSVFPAALAIVSLIGVVGNGPDVINRVLNLLGQVAPGAVTNLLQRTLTDVTTPGAANIAFILGVVVAFWSASSYVSAFGRAMNRVYNIAEGRPYWKRKPAQLAVTVLVLLLVLLVAGIVALSEPVVAAVGGALNISSFLITAWEIGKWPLLSVAITGIVGVLYATTSNIRPPRFRWLSLGALLAIILIGAASVGFAFYVSNLASYNQTFGAFAGVIIFLIWVFLINVSLLLGAEFNAELERGRELQAGISAESALQLPLRDTSASERTNRTAAIDEHHGILLRKGIPLPARTDTLPARIQHALLTIYRRMRRGR